MYLPTDINIWLSFHPILERVPNPYNVLSKFTQMSAHPGTSFTQLIRVHSLSFEKYSIKCYAYLLCYVHYMYLPTDINI